MHPGSWIPAFAGMTFWDGFPVAAGNDENTDLVADFVKQRLGFQVARI